MGSIEANWKLDGWDKVLDRLSGTARESLARRVAVAGGRVLRDEAKANVKRHMTTHVYNPNSRGSQADGTLEDAIYLAYRDTESTTTMFKYSVTWNDTKAWWGKLREFGYFIRYPWYLDDAGVFHTYHAQGGKGKGTPLDKPHYVPPVPFLGPAMNVLPEVRVVMLETGRREMAKLLKGEE